MKLANNANIRVFCREEEDKEGIVEKLKLLLPFDLEKEKIKIEEKKAEGFEDKIITVLSVALMKERHVNAFIDNLREKLWDKTQTIIEQTDSRVDDSLDLFIRLDKEMLLKDKFVLTDGGNCYHIKINLAAFPKRKEKAASIVKVIFKRKQ